MIKIRKYLFVIPALERVVKAFKGVTIQLQSPVKKCRLDIAENVELTLLLIDTGTHSDLFG